MHLFWGDTTEQIVANMKTLRAMAAKHGRESDLGFGMRLQIVCRENEKDAWEAADKLVRNVTAERTTTSRPTTRTRSPTGACRSWRARRATSSRPTCGAASPRRAPAPASASSAIPSSAPTCCSSYIDIGCHSFCLSGYLHDAEAERFHRMVRPILADRNRGRMKAA